jgi:hypothetical protein
MLFLIGNGIWALIHLSNYNEEKDREILRVLPQFTAGIFFTYVFVKYGLFEVILAHFASNAVLFAMHKVENINIGDVLIVGYYIACASISYALIDKPLIDILPWFADNLVFRLQGWEFWDYVKVSVFLSSFLVLVFDLLMYDRGKVGQNKLGFTDYIIGIMIVNLLLYGTYALLGLFIINTPYLVLVIAILFTFLQRGASGSAMARTFWSGLPSVYVTICILQALGFWPAIGWVAVRTAIDVPRIILNKLNS